MKKIILSMLCVLNASYLFATTYYVDASRPDDTGNGLGWGTAKKTILAAVDVAVAGDTVLVTNGLYNVGTKVNQGYSLKNRVVVTNNITVRSVNGSSVTIIEGSGINFYGTTSAIRCVYMSAGTLDGFTLQKGATLQPVGDYNYWDCVGGCASCVPGGGRQATIRNCVLRDSKALNGGGGDSITLFENCLIIGNTADSGGAGCGLGSLVNCTITKNSAVRGGGTWGGAHYNCIVWDNTGGNYQTGDIFNYSCTTPLPAGSGNISTDPLFINAASNDFRLQAGSPCVNTGLNSANTTAYDLLGNPRIFKGIIDIGAYELISALTVTFNAQGGAASVVATNVTYKVPYGNLPNATRTGYTFGGWFFDETNQITNETVVSATTNHTLTVHWNPNSYTVTFDPQGGETGYASKDLTYGSTYGELPWPYRVGYTFSGWSATTNGVVFGVYSNTIVTIASNHVIKALWVAESNALSFVSTGALSTPRNTHATCLLPDGQVLVAGGYGGSGILASAEVYNPATKTWIPTSSMNTGRVMFVSVLLPNGKVLVAGGGGENSCLASSEIFEPINRAWRITGSMSCARVQHTATLLKNGKVLVVGGYRTSPTFVSWETTELYDPSNETWTVTGSLNINRHGHTAALLPSGKVLVTGGYGSSGTAQASAELYDPETGTWELTGSMGTPRTEHTSTLLPSGKVLVAGNDSSSGSISLVEIYDPETELWSSTGSMPGGRWAGFRTTLLPNGKVLFSGGRDSAGVIGSTHLYDPVTGLWRSAEPMRAARQYHSSILLPDGKVLIAGGQSTSKLSSSELYDPSASWRTTGSLPSGARESAMVLLKSGKVLLAGGLEGTNYLSRSTLYDPASETWQTVGNLNVARSLHSLTLLENGQVLAVGGYNGTEYLMDTELFNPVTETWTTATSLSGRRGHHTATLLTNGLVLVTGGSSKKGDASGTLSSSEIYDLSTGVWTNTGPMNAVRYGHQAILLQNGKVLVMGGANGYSNGERTSAELFDPAARTWTSTVSMKVARFLPSATLLPDGKVLVAGGWNSSSTYLSSSELYDPSAVTWTLSGTMKAARCYHTATLLSGGRIFVAGGRPANNSVLNLAEIYDAGTGLWLSTRTMTGSRANHTATLLPNGKVLVTGGSVLNGETLSSSELWEPGLNYRESWRPQISTFSSPLVSGEPLILSGDRFRGVSGASGGITEDSSTDFPLVKLYRFDNGQTSFLTPSNWTSSTYTSTAISNIAPGRVQISVYVNGIPSQPVNLDSTTHYVVTFNPDGGTVSPANKTVTYGSDYGDLPLPSRAGYTFVRWQCVTNGVVFGVWSNSVVSVASNHTLLCQWSTNSYQVAFDATGGTVDLSEKTVIYASAYGVLPVPVKIGYVFVGWWDATSGGTQIVSSSLVSSADNHTLYARWTPQVYAVTLNPNGGTGGSTSVNATFDAPMPAASAPSMMGMSFNGYFDQPEGGNQYYSATMTSMTNWTTAGAATLYARWVSRGVIRLQQSVYSVSEDGGVIAVKAERVGGSNGTASVSFVVEGVSATEDADYTYTTSTFTWLENKTGTKTIAVLIEQDDLVEGNETFTVRLINATGAVLGTPSEALVTIVDDDAAESRIIRIAGGGETGTLDFGSVATNSSSAKVIYVWNDGNQPFSVTNVTAAAGFSVSQAAFTVEAGSMVAMTVNFSPPLLQAYTGTLTVWSVNTTGPSTLTLAGTGVQPPPTVGMRKIKGLNAIISIDVPTNATVLAVEDTLAPGLFPVSISDKGSWDSVNRKVKWFFDKKPDLRDRALQYTVNGLGSVTGGIVNFGSDNHPVSGDTEFVTGGDPGVLHPADANGDWRITIEEIASHITRWNQGLEDVKTAYAIRGITLYLSSETYAYDAGIPPGAKRWVPSVSGAPWLKPLAVPDASVRALSEPPAAGAVRQVYATNVTISVTPETGTKAYGLEETIPECLYVAGISAGGVWDSNNRKIKWSFDDGTPRSLSYAVAGPEGTNVTLIGLVSFDGSEDPITGQPELMMPVSFGTWASRNGHPTSDLPSLFQTVNGISGLAYGFEYAFGTNVQSTALLNIRFVNGRLILETPMRDGLSLPYLNVSVLGSTNLVDWTLPTTPAADQSGKPSNCDWYESSVSNPAAFFRLKAELK